MERTSRLCVSRRVRGKVRRGPAALSCDPQAGLRAEHSANSAVCLVSTQAFGLSNREACMNGIIYLIGLIVVVMAILSFLGLR
jgi:hypothetical protein